MYTHATWKWLAVVALATGGALGLFAADTDTDGIDDDWELGHFDTLADCGPTDDTDGDGFSNLKEFQLQTDPRLYEVHLEIGWNLVSLARVPDDNSVDAIFGEAFVPPAWGWGQQKYSAVDTVSPLQGIWLYCQEQATIDLTFGGSDPVDPVDPDAAYELSFVPIAGGTITMGEEAATHEGPPGSHDSTPHSVTLTAFEASETEVTNQQYTDFLNAAHAAGYVEVILGPGPGQSTGKRIVYGTGTAPEAYRSQELVNLDGTRVMKDHDNGDGDGNPFTGVIEPENPLNLCYVGYDETRSSGEPFYVRNPRDTSDLDWDALTNYYNYTDTQHQPDTAGGVLNDYDAWPELVDFPNNMPTLDDVRDWPATFVRWYGAKAFATHYGYTLPTEAQWEYAAQGGDAFAYATADGLVDEDGTSAVWNWKHEEPALGHVQDVKTHSPNPYGLYNMAGNVWEWCEDSYATDFYTTAAALEQDPVSLDNTGFKVRRGGSWNYHKATLKSASRWKDETFKGNDHFGFRVVRQQ